VFPVPFHRYRFAAILGVTFTFLTPVGGTELRSETPDEQVATYYPQSLLDVMTKEQLDDLVRDILADPHMADVFIKSIGGEATRHRAWWDSLKAFLRARRMDLDAFRMVPLTLVVHDRFSMQKEENKKRLTPEQFELLYRPEPPQQPIIKFKRK
jgi:hypothetical protein